MLRQTITVIAAAPLLALSSTAAEKVTYDDHVVPVLRNHCLKCHDQDKKKGDLDLSSYNGLMAGGGSGKTVEPGNVEDSLLWKLMMQSEEPKMPPRSPKIPDAELAVVRRWIEGGVLENSGSKAMAAAKPKLDLAIKEVSLGRPAGPPPLPNGDLLLEPVAKTERAGAVPALAASPWAPLVAVAGQRQVILYHLDTFELAGILPYPEGFPYVVRFSRNGRLLLIGGGIGARFGNVALFDVETGRRVATIGDEYDAVLAADLSPDHATVALGGSSKLLRIYSTATGELLHTVKKHTDWVTAIAYSPDGVLLASGDRNGGVHLWEAFTAQPYSELKSHQQCVTAIDWRDDANVVATTAEDGQIMLWTVENSARVRNWTAHGGGSQAVRFSHDGRLVSAGRDRTAKLWDGNGGGQRTFPAFGDIAMSVAVSHDLAKVIAADFQGNVRVWNATNGTELATFSANPPALAERLAVDQKKLTAITTEQTQAAEAKAAAQKVADETAASLARMREQASQRQAAAKAMETEMNEARRLQTQAETAKQETAKQVQAMRQERERQEAAKAAARKALEQQQASRSQGEQALAAAKSVKQAAAEAKNRIAAAGASNPLLAAAMAETAKAALASSEAVAALEKSLAEIGAQIQAGETAVKVASAKAAEATGATAVAERALADADTALTTAAARANSAAEAQRLARAAADETEKAVAGIEAQARSANEAFEKARLNLAGKSARVTELRRNVDRWLAGRVNVQLFAATADVDKLLADQEAAAADLARLTAAADRQAADLAALEAGLAAAPTRVNAAGEKLAASSDTFATESAALEKMRSNAVRLEAVASERHARNEEITGLVRQTESTLKVLREAHANAEAGGRTALATMAKLEEAAKAAAGNPQLTEALARSKAVVDQSAALRNAAAKSLAEIENQLKTRTAEADKAKSELEVARRDEAAAKQAVASQQTLVAKARAELETATAAVKTAQTEAEELTKKVAVAKAAAAKAGEEAAAARRAVDEAARAVAPLKERRQQLLAEYQKLKPRD